MKEYNDFFDMFFSNFKKLIYPEEWIDLDFSFSKSEILAMLIVERYGEIIMSQVADYISIPMSTATGIVDRLVRNGFMQREKSDTDRRIVVIRLTDKGKEITGSIKKTIIRYVNMVSESLTDEEKKLLYGIFMKVMDVLNRESKDTGISNEDSKELRKIEIE